MKRVELSTIAIVFVAIFISCKSTCDLEDRMEGFNNGNLRVYVRAYLDDLEDESDESIKHNLLERGQKRAASLLAGYFITDLKDKAKIEDKLKKMTEVLKDAKINFQECYNEYCEAFIDYGVKSLVDGLDFSVSGKEKTDPGNN